MRIRTIDGEIYSGRSYRRIVAEMAGSKPENPGSLEAYRAGAAQRAQEMFGAEVDPSSNAKFIQSLIDQGLVDEI